MSSTTTVIASSHVNPSLISQRQGRSKRNAINAAVTNSPGNGANCTKIRLRTKTFNPNKGSTKLRWNQLGQAFI
ncbi:hypothetical protein [Synechococcus sp. M16CYN]|uniref:hypothetical protein n=1 Tax=Synechococcus sp. M16CYN TaxID=3103139 RepID=UPI00333E9504